MGRRSGDTQGDGARLGEDDSGDLSQFAADLIDQSLAGQHVRLAAVAALAQQGFEL